MNKNENLKKDYLFLKNCREEYRKTLEDFLNKSLATFKNGVAVLNLKYKTLEEADEAGEDFNDQFPVCITIVDKHGFNHEIYITRLYKKNGLYFVDGWDSSDGEWIEGWYTDDSNNTYDDLCCFLAQVLALEEEPEIPQESEISDNQPCVLIGWQLMDENNSYPSEFGWWDAFRSYDDAELYRQEVMAEPDDWRIIEKWNKPCTVDSYRYHKVKEREFKKGEKVLVVLSPAPYFAFVRKGITVKSGIARVAVNEINSSDEWIQTALDNEFIYQLDENLKCPKCGKPMYSAWHTNLPPHCTACEGLE